eukprot:6212955-Pleurochrysis_carterae.AAC.2
MQRAFAATTVTRQASVGCYKRAIRSRQPAILLDDRPHRQSLWLKALSAGGHSGVSGILKNLEKPTSAKQNAKTRKRE